MRASRGETQLTAPAHLDRIDDIQVLRAVAISCVMVEHSWFNLLTNQTWLTWLLRHVPLWSGVDLFFVISGFVITRGLLPSVLAAQRGGPVLARFYIRRAFRLWPAAWLWLGFMLLGSCIFANRHLMGTPALNVQGALAGVFGYANFRFASMPGQPYGPSHPYWSLSLEEQFYLLLPPLLLLARQRIVWVAAALILVQLPLAHPRLYFYMRNEGLWWGVLLAAAPAAAPLAARVAAAVARVPLAGVAILAASIGTMAWLSPFFEQSPPYVLGAMAAVAAVPVFLASGNQALFSFGWAQPAVLWLGSRSYALYLCHVPLYECSAAMARALAGRAPGLHNHVDLCAATLAVPLLWLAAQATFHWVEQPLRRHGARLAAGGWDIVSTQV